MNDVASILNHRDHMSVVDIRSAYRSLSVYKGHTKYQGFLWNGKFHIDHRLCFGLSSAPFIFDNMSHFIVKAANSMGVEIVINYLDDFITIHWSPLEC